MCQKKWQKRIFVAFFQVHTGCIIQLFRIKFAIFDIANLRKIVSVNVICLKKRTRSFFSSATGYIVIGIFCCLPVAVLWVIPGEFNILEAGYANTDGLFTWLRGCFWCFVRLSPCGFCRRKAKPEQELIIQTTDNPTNCVGKIFCRNNTGHSGINPDINLFLYRELSGRSLSEMDAGQFWGSFIGLIFLAAVYTAIGTFTSSLTKIKSLLYFALVLCFFLLWIWSAHRFCGAVERKCSSSKISAFTHTTSPSAAE